MEYRKANVNSTTSMTSRQKVKWELPSSGVIKVNVDAAVNDKESRFCMGFVAHDSFGTVVLAASKTRWPLATVERAELKAFQWAVEIIKSQNWSQVLLEGDASNVVLALQ